MQLTYMNPPCVDGRTNYANDFYLIQNNVETDQSLQCQKSLSYPVVAT